MHKLFTKLSAGLYAGCLAAVLPAAAQMSIPVYTGTPLMITGGVLNQQVLRDAERLTRRAPESAPQKLIVGRPVAPRELASHYPAAQRAQAEQLFTELLLRYRSIEDRFSIPRHDLGGALAAFIAGSHMAYRNEPFPDEHFGPLVQQMRRVLGANPAVARAPLADRQQAYEQLAILGMFMAGAQIAQREKPDAQAAERLRVAGGQYLERLLAVAPSRVQIGPQGLALGNP